MKKPPHTEKRGGQWWYRRRVPAQLIPLVGRAEFRESLQTPDVEVARVRAALRDAAVAIEFEKARAQVKRAATVPTLPAVLSFEEKRYVSEAIRAHVLNEDEEVRMSRPCPDSLEAYESIRSDQFDESVRALASGRVAWGGYEKARMVELLRAIGLPLTPDSQGWDVVAYKATEGLHLALRDISQRMNGNFIPTPAPLPMPSNFLPALPAVEKVLPKRATLGDVIEHYLNGLPENGFRRKVRRCLQLFAEMLGRDLEVQDLRQKAVTQFLRDICRLPDKWARRFDAGESIASMLAEKAPKVMSPTTYEGNYRSPLGTFLAIAARYFGDEGFRLLTPRASSTQGTDCQRKTSKGRWLMMS